jgi:DNA-binding GntR family transcriptional regulator
VSKKIIDANRISASGEIGEELGLAASDEVVVIRRVRIAGKRPAIYSVDALPADIVDAKRDLKAFSGSLYRLLASRGHDVDHARTIITPVLPTKEIATILDVAPGTPLQHLRQVDYSIAGRPVMRSLEWHVPSVIELRVYRRGPGPMPA